MSKMHFMMIAAGLKRYLSRIDYNDKEFVELVNDIANGFESVNPNFDRQRFISAIYD